MLARDGVGKRGLALFVYGVDVCSAYQQGGKDVVMPARRRAHEGRHADLVARVHLHTIIEQHPYRFQFAQNGGFDWPQFGSRVNQQRDRFRLAAKRGVEQGSLAKLSVIVTSAPRSTSRRMMSTSPVMETVCRALKPKLSMA